MKKFLCLILMSLFLQDLATECMARPKYTAIDVDNNTLYFILDKENKIAELNSYGRYTFESITIPTEVSYEGDTYSVTLGKGTFASAYNLVSIVVPSHFKSLPENFASGCEKLLSISLPPTLERIEDGAFYNCKSLETIVLPDNLKYLGHASEPFTYGPLNGVFYESGIKSITIPGGVDSIGNQAFRYCRNLREITISEGTKLIGKDCICDCDSLTIVNLPNTLTTIHANNFRDCTALKSLDLPQSVTHIGGYSLNNTGIESIIIPPHLEVIRVAFLGRTPVTTLTIPEGVKRLSPRALYNTTLKELTIADSDEELSFDLTADNQYGRDPWGYETSETYMIGQWLPKTLTDIYVGRNSHIWIHPDYPLTDDVILNPFEELTTLENITLGTSLTDASYLTFGNYPNLKTITFLSSVPPEGIAPLTEEQVSTVKVIVPGDAIEAYKNVEALKDVLNFEASGVSVVDNQENVKTEYFNLNGIKVENPCKGIFIRRCGEKYEKVML